MKGRANVKSDKGGASALGSEGGGKVVIHDRGGVVRWTEPTVGVWEGIMSKAMKGMLVILDLFKTALTANPRTL